MIMRSRAFVYVFLASIWPLHSAGKSALVKERKYDKAADTALRQIEIRGQGEAM